MKNRQFIAAIALMVFLMNCSDNVKYNDYYIINSGQFSIVQIQDTSVPPPPPPPPPPKIVTITGLYTKIVILLDSSDAVYMYQTDRFRGNGHKNEYYVEKYQDIIELKPEHLIRFRSEEFIDFVKQNNDIFHFDSTTSLIRAVYFASNKDTLLNPAFYDFIKLTNANKKSSNVFYDVRRTTEEENYVMYCKRNNIKYEPSNYKWSANSLAASYKPFTKQFDSVQRNLFDYIIRPKLTFRIDTIPLNRYDIK